jgi:hypothetical protein
MRSDLLHVIGVIANPMRFKRRVELFKRFMHHMLESRVRLAVVECGFGDREWEIPVHPDVMHVRVRANTVNWAKENLINIGISRLPHDWEYVAWVDGDIHFRHAEWASETVHALQQYCIIQPWADCLDLGPHGELIEHHKSFADRWWHRRIHDWQGLRVRPSRLCLGDAARGAGETGRLD